MLYMSVRQQSIETTLSYLQISEIEFCGLVNLSH